MLAEGLAAHGGRVGLYLGATFGVIFGGRVASYASGLGFGTLYGAVWWILGPLLIMSAMMGMPLFMITAMTLMSLVGHPLYGAVAGAPLIAAAIGRAGRPRNAPACGTFLGPLCP